MATMHIGFVSAAAVFAKHVSSIERDDGLRMVEVEAEEGGRCLRDDIAAQFAALCDLAIKHVLRSKRSTLRTLRAEAGYGFAENQKGWLRLGCEVFVDEEEMDEAYDCLEEPGNAALLELRIRAATEEFASSQLPRSLFSEVSAAFYLLEDAERA